MRGRIPDTVIQQILDRVNLADLIGQQVKLKKSGRNYSGLCPFHADKDPSFTVSPEKGFFYCFGCKEGGNAVSYLTKLRGYSYLEAIEELANVTGVELQFDRVDQATWKKSREKKREMLALNKLANSFYRMSLSEPQASSARRYLEERGLTAQIMSDFQVGYSIPGGSLYRHLAAQGAPLNLAEEIGLIVVGRSGKHTDRLQDRVMFPILTVSNDIAGFSGRMLPGGRDPKYLNSPDSKIFTKGELLFGLVQGRDAIKKDGFCLLVEGQIDVLALHQSGLQNAAAPLGTALTEHQALVIRRFTDQVVLMFDGDDAGRKAAWRGMTVLMGAGVYGRMAKMPDGEDPDSLLRSGGPEAVRAVVDQARPFLEFAVENIVASAGSELRGRSLAARKGMDFASALPNSLDRQVFLQRLSTELRLSPDSLRVRAAVAGSPDLAEGDQRSFEPLTPMEKELVRWLLLLPELARRLSEDEVFDLLRSQDVKSLVTAVLDELEEYGVVELEKVVSGLENPALRDFCAQQILSDHQVEESKVQDGITELLDSLRRNRLSQQHSELAVQIKQAEARGEGDLAMELLGMQVEVEQELGRAMGAEMMTLKL